MTPLRGDRWRGRPVLSTCLRLAVFAVPIGAAVGASSALVRVLTPPHGVPQLIAEWVFTFAVSTGVLVLVNKLMRRLMPLAVLLKLSLVFPDEAPSRLRIARRATSTRDLRVHVERARSTGVVDEPARTAEAILGLVAAVEAHDRATRGHSERVRILTDMLADEMNLGAWARDRLRWAALLHDVGKLAVPAAVLNKPAKLEADEWDLVRAHPGEGARLIAPLREWLGPWAAAVEEHHERWDGTGYPRGLSGENISLGGRIVALTDAFETMTAARPYRKPMNAAAARAELVRCSGTEFDPTIVRAFLQISVRRLSLVSGPLSWLAQMPILLGLEQAAGVAGRAAAGLAAGGAALSLTLGGPAAPNPESKAPVERAAGSGVVYEQTLAPSPTPGETAVATPTSSPTASPTPTTKPALSPSPTFTGKPRPIPTWNPIFPRSTRPYGTTIGR